MNAWDKFLDIVKRGLVEVGLLTSDGNLPMPKNRVIAASQLFSKVYGLLDEMNLAARKIGADGYAYVDWDIYLRPMDVYYDDDGALFVLCARGGKLFRIPVNVSGEEVSLDEPVEIPLNGRSIESNIRVIRTADGKRRWLSVAASSVLNRVGEIDSTALFDSFITYAEQSRAFPTLSFYHKDHLIRFGVADFLARDGYLYIATGDFDETPVGQALADGLERSTDEWGTSIGYLPTSEPELLRVGDVNIPVYNAGINTEISIVLERDAAAHFTNIRTEEVLRYMDKSTRDKLAGLVGPELADQLAAQDDETNRAIDANNLIARAGDTAPATAAPAASAPVATAAPVPTAPTEAPAVAETTTRETEAPAAQSIEIPEEMYDALAESFVGNPAIQTLMQTVNTMNETLAQLAPRVGALETNTETRLAALELDEQTRTQTVLDDLPATRTIVTVRPRNARAVELDEHGQAAAPDSTVIANSTLEKINAKRGQQHA